MIEAKAIKIAKWSLQLILLALGYWLLYRHFSGNNNWHELKTHFHLLITHTNAYWLFLALALMPLNWLTEAYRWKLILKPLELNIPFHVFIKGILAGLSSGTFTPNRIGEIPGRLWILPQGNRTNALLLTSIYSSLQLVVSLLIGGASLVLIPVFITHIPGQDVWIQRIGGFLAIMVSIVIFLSLYSNGKIWFFRKYLPHFIQSRTTTLQIHQSAAVYRLLLVTGLRYFIYASQYTFIVYSFETAIPFASLFPAIFILLMFMSVSPSMFLIDMGIRGSLAVFVLSHFGVSDIAAVLTVGVAWVVNIILPSIPGVYFLVRKGGK